ncbi:MAG TPA: hypothetical protein VJM34_09975 [Novosphingobium sp.]|nr:hypothetical protein [Novosphingobium sp.]
MSIDTLAIARSLRAAEMPQPHAEAIAAAIGSSILDVAATKTDLGHVEAQLKGDLGRVEAQLKGELGRVETQLKGDIAQVESRLETKIEQLRSQMMVWFIATNLTIGAIILAALKL